MTRILIADDHAVVRTGIRRTLEDHPNWSVVAEAADGKAFWTEDPSARIVQKKLLIRYETDCPVELLCYTGGRLVTPDDVIIPTLRALFEHGSGSFRKAWLFGETGVHEVWSAS